MKDIRVIGNLSKTTNRFRDVESPIREMIAKHEESLNEFDLEKVLEWNTDNIRKYKLYINRFENRKVMLNLMHLDK